MKKIDADKIFNTSVEFSYLAVIFLVPLYFSIFFKTNNVFELNKIVLFKILILILLHFTIIKIFFIDKIFKIFFVPKYFLAIFLFLLAALLSTLLSINPITSFLGFYERQQGLTSLIYCITFFILLCFNLDSQNNKEDKFIKINRIIWTVVLSSFLVSLYGLAQIAGYDFTEWTEPASLTGRATSSLGQPNFLASYLLLVVAFSIYLFVKSKKFLIKFILGVITLIQLLCLFFTYSRAGWIGFILGALITGIVYVLTVGINKEKIAILFKNKLAIFIFITVIFGSVILIINNPLFVDRIKSMADAKSGSTAVRLNFWKASMDAIKKRPIFGYGPDVLGDVFVKYYKNNWAVYGRVNDYPDKAHNLFLDIILSSGVVGLLSFLYLLYLFFKLIINNIKNSRDYKSLSIIILFSVASYLISLIFGFAVVVTNIYFWLLFAITLSISSEQRNKEKTIYIDEKRRLNFLNSYTFLIIIILINLAIFYQISREFKKIIADYYFRELKVAYLNKEYFKAMEIYSYIKGQKINDYYYDYSFAMLMSDVVAENEELANKKAASDIIVKMLPQIKTNNYSDIFLRAKIYAALASYENKEQYDLAEKNFKEAISLSPELPQNYREFAKMYFIKGDYQKAVDNYNKALSFLPDLDNPYMNDQHKWFVRLEKYLIYKDLADIFLKENSYSEAEKYYWLAYYSNMLDTSLFKKISDTYYLKGDLDKAIWYNKRGYMLNPNDYAWPFAIALLYKEKGDNIQAKEYAEKAVKLAPDKREIINFMEDLK